MTSYFVRGRCSCLNESNAPWDRDGKTVVSKHDKVPYPFAVNSDICLISKPVTLQFGYLLDGLHVGCVAPSTENHGNFGFGIDVGRSDQCSRGITCESNKVHRDVLSSL